MRTWVFVVGLLTCSLLFYLSGTLTGYLYSERVQATKREEEDNNKKKRTPSAVSKNSVLRRSVEMQIDMQKNALLSRVGIPIYLP
ncbi:MAG: hypothetical protein LBP31_03265 [Holosporales bacterium]|jgi:hypothetical protein|nr:hypothetical protein [Holosporales bacterium]